jgi:hypothetical protein
MKKSRADKNAAWIVDYCLDPADRTRVRLSAAEREQLRELYATPDGPRDIAVTGRLAAFLCLLHLLGREAEPHRDFRGPIVDVNIWTLWQAASPRLQQYLRRDGRRITCIELGTSFEAAA